MDAAQREILAANLKRVRERIAAACARVKRDPKDVTLIAVTKTVGPEVIQALIELGVTDIGENKLQAAQEKFPKVPGLRDRAKVKRHFIGHLQTNKVKGVLELFDVIHSVDSVKLAKEIDKRVKENRLEDLECFLEVNLAGEETKTGIHLENMDLSLFCENPFLAAAVQLFKNYIEPFGSMKVTGLMTMAPSGGDLVEARQCFNSLLCIDSMLLQMCSAGPDPLSLSMGMSNDFEIAIEEGATHVRIGTALFEGL